PLPSHQKSSPLSWVYRQYLHPKQRMRCPSPPPKHKPMFSLRLHSGGQLSATGSSHRSPLPLSLPAPFSSARIFHGHGSQSLFSMHGFRSEVSLPSIRNLSDCSSAHASCPPIQIVPE